MVIFTRDKGKLAKATSKAFPPSTHSCKQRRATLTYPCIMQDDESGMYFIAGSTGPRSWRYHHRWWGAWWEMITSYWRAR
jgi:hypothetical protein